MKRARLIQMINYLTPISQQEYPEVAQRVMMRTEVQLDAIYAQLYQKYLIKVEEEKKNAQKEGQTATIVSMPNEDEFSSNNFKNV